MKPPHQSEEVLQEIVAAWLDLWGVLWWHTPNGGKRHKAVAAKMKRAGQKAGVPDVMIFEQWHRPRTENGGQPYHFGLAIELKVKGNYPTKTQKAMMADLEARGWRVAVCRSLDEVKEACQCLRPLHGRAAPY